MHGSKYANVAVNEAASPSNSTDWIHYVTKLRQKHPFAVPQSEAIGLQYAISLLSEVTGGDAIASLGVGQHQMWAMQHYRASGLVRVLFAGAHKTLDWVFSTESTRITHGMPTELFTKGYIIS